MRQGMTWRRRVLLLAAAAVALRLLLFLGRGDYLAFDEGWYLLLARSLYTGDGYSLIGIPHTALSPLFPILAGAAGVVLDSWVWGGRVVAALASGLLVLPAWAVFRRLAPERTAFIAAALVAVMPSMAPFVAAFWIGADLWVGAEPILHLFLYTGVALWLRADEEGDGGGLPVWALAGAAFGLAFLARPEAILTWGFLGLAALALAAWKRAPRRLAGAALMGLAFVVVAAPYWLYIRDVSGEWSLSGRGVSAVRSVARLAGPGGGGAAGTIERMLWEDDEGYATHLYSLDASGLRLRSGYWGVQPPPAAAPDAVVDPAPDTEGQEAAASQEGAASQEAAASGAGAEPAGRSPLRLFLRTLGTILPLLLWPFVILGAAMPRGRAVLRRELPVTLSLVATSIAVAVVVAVDPRTQLFLVPLLAFYAARGFALVEHEIRRRADGRTLRPGFAELALAAVALAWLLGIHAQRLYLSLSAGSPHHVVGEHNRRVAEELDALLGDDDGPVMSWHPALAVFADRGWRPMPLADFPGIIRFAGAAGAEVIIASAYYPPDLGVEGLDTRYLLLPVPEGSERLGAWSMRIERADSLRALGRLSVPR